MTDSGVDSSTPAIAGGRGAPPAEAPLNVERLADRVYRLFVDEVRLGLARGERGLRVSAAGRRSGV
jgi:hypothetical protein